MDKDNNEDSLEVLDFDGENKTDKIIDTPEVENENETNENKEESKPEVKTTKKEIVKEKTVTKTVEKKDNNNKQKNQKKEDNKNKEKEISKKENNNNTVIKEVVVKKSSAAPIIVMIIVFLLLIGAIFALPYVNDYFEQKRNPVNNNNITTNQNTEEETKEEKFESNIDVKKALLNIKDTKSYQYKNTINLYAKDENNEKFTIENDYTYLFNETKYEVNNTKDVGDFTYNTVDYYEKLDDKYYIYQNDITNNTYSKDETTNDKFSSIYNLFSNTINYLANNHEITNEKQIDDKINITLKVNKKILENLSYETSRIKNTIDISKLSIDNVIVELYFNNNKELESIEFEVEDKNIYQEDVDGSIESAISKYTFDSFNNIKDIELPNA